MTYHATDIRTANGRGAKPDVDALIVDARESTRKPRDRLTRDGYTVAAGSPTSIEVRLFGEKRWRRVYVVCFSNIGSCFIRTKTGRIYCNPMRVSNGKVVC